MPNIIDGNISLRQLIQNTYRSKFRSRFKYKTRDVLKKVIIIKQTTLHPDRLNSPTITYIFRSYSYPQYTPYNKHVSGNAKQRKYKHQYDQVLSIVADDNGKFSMDSTDWKYRLGSQKKWQDNVPQSKVKTIYKETQEKWKKEKFEKRERLIRRYSGEVLKKKIKQLDEEFKKKIEQHKKSAPYLDKGDYCSRVLGINGDFAFRCQKAYQAFGHLYGRMTEPGCSDDLINMFAPKHMLALIDFLIKIGILV